MADQGLRTVRTRGICRTDPATDAVQVAVSRGLNDRDAAEQYQQNRDYRSQGALFRSDHGLARMPARHC